MRTILTTILIQVILCGVAVADRTLENEEIIKIFETLTSQPKKTWITSGTIRANHEQYKAPKVLTDPGEIDRKIDEEVRQYKANTNKIQISEKLRKMRQEAIPFNTRYELSNEYMMNSNETVKYDGDRFYWEINVVSRVDSVQPTADLADNSFASKFDIARNKISVFVWDGSRYTKYYKPGNQAIITGFPSSVNGPLTAGVIPWGYGTYSFESLCSAEPSANEVETDGDTKIELKIINNDRREILVLDPEMEYAVTSYTAIVENTSMTVCDYSNYKLIGTSWCPGGIITEQYDTTTKLPRLIARDIWDLRLVTNETPQPESFEINYEFDALIEDRSLGGKPLQYRFAAPQDPSVRNIDVNEALQSRLEIMDSKELLSGQNCATVSIKYICTKLGLNLSWQELGRLVHDPQKGTTIFEMQQFIDSLGLNSVAVTTDLQTLKELNNCHVILHLPKKNHYVVLGNIDEKYVRLIDLDRNKFFYRNSIEHFSSIWDGTALLITDKSIETESNLAKLNDKQLINISGAASCESCTDKIQSSGESYCPDGFNKSCGGYHTIYYERWGCETSTSGSCEEDDMISKESAACGADPYNPGECDDDGHWVPTWIDACE